MTRMPAKEICEALGIDPSCTTRLLITAEGVQLIRVEISMVVKDERLDKFLEVLKQYELHEKPEKV
ncbi:hypothetical protein JQR88_10920 [Pseudomonas luteola]|uniref:hypothetical protein n=1 Tax=Pseudomonas luteola TaxID=47886 RepID=UPI003DA007EB